MKILSIIFVINGVYEKLRENSLNELFSNQWKCEKEDVVSFYSFEIKKIRIQESHSHEYDKRAYRVKIEGEISSTYFKLNFSVFSVYQKDFTRKIKKKWMNDSFSLVEAISSVWSMSLAFKGNPYRWRWRVSLQ